MTASGYSRLTHLQADDAVSWWYYKDFDDGFAYARGGRCRSARQARKLIRDCSDEALREHRLHLDKRSAILGNDGELIPIEDVHRHVHRSRPARQG